MTLEEKIGQMTLFTSDWDKTGPTMRSGYLDDIRRGRVGAIFNAYTPEFTKKLQAVAYEETRLGIPLLFGYDVIHGHRTVFPIPLAEACSWDLGMIEGAARIAATEAAADGLHWTFAPMVDIARDPRWGRIAEGAGEDVYLGCLIARARVRGLRTSALVEPLAPQAVLADRYRVEEVVARGGLAFGYRVHDQKFSTTWYLQQIDASGGDVDGFTRRATRLAHLRHPGLAQVVDHWVAPPHAFVVREWVAGESLADRLARHPQGLPLDQVVDLGSKVLDVLHFLHTGYDPLAFGVLSPRTVWVGEDDETRLVDFGLPAFFAGEGGKGSLGEDVRACGVLLYTMATGRAPDADPRAPREVRPEIPAALSQVILKAMHADPAQRHHDVGAVKHDLMAVAEEFAPDETPSAGAVASIAEPGRKAEERQGCGAAAVVALGLVLLLIQAQCP